MSQAGSKTYIGWAIWTAGRERMSALRAKSDGLANPTGKLPMPFTSARLGPCRHFGGQHSRNPAHFGGLGKKVRSGLRGSCKANGEGLQAELAAASVGISSWSDPTPNSSPTAIRHGFGRTMRRIPAMSSGELMLWCSATEAACSHSGRSLGDNKLTCRLRHRARPIESGLIDYNEMISRKSNSAQ